MNLGITYDTPHEKIIEAKKILQELLENHEGMPENFPPRIFFNDFKDSSLNFLVIYWYSPPAYWDYMNFSENLNLEIIRRFNEAGIGICLPISNNLPCRRRQTPNRICS